MIAWTIVIFFLIVVVLVVWIYLANDRDRRKLEKELDDA